ncbi:MAG TPA: redox-sensing transcriptional repressor Rex [Clostridiales bacterium]|nr:redox-sensing transcriptional repressor Rex [Clostridiales bacterium]HQP70024.1 redox-sensing transcriptional repressor Rex [Clostridiales bacterium]
MEPINGKTIERLSLYRRLLKKIYTEGTGYFYSHDLAKMAHVTSVQVRRDLMYIGYSGNNRKGYETKGVMDSIGEIMDTKNGMNICIVGIGNLGKALVNFLHDKSEKLKITALFDIDENLIGKNYMGVPCYHVDRLSEKISEENISIGMIAASSRSAKDIAEKMTASGIKAIINYTTTPLNLPENTFLEEIDITTSLEKASYFAKVLGEKKISQECGKKILVIDDDSDIVNIYTVILKKNGYEVSSSLNSKEGFSMISKFKPDLIILDIMMEDPDAGFLFLNELKEKNINIPVILQSSIAKATSNVLDVSQLNIKIILQKPVDPDDLILKIKKYI